MKKLQKEYYRICNQYLLEFCKKHEWDFEWWVSDEPGTIAMIGDYFIAFDQMRYDIDNNIDEAAFIKWYDYALELGMEDKNFLSYESWCKMTVNGSQPLSAARSPKENTKVPQSFKDAVEAFKKHLK